MTPCLSGPCAPEAFSPSLIFNHILFPPRPKACGAFGPQSVNDFLKLLNMPETMWKQELEEHQKDSYHLSGRNQP